MSQEVNGVAAFGARYFPNIPLSTLRALVKRKMAAMEVLFLGKLSRDHSICPTCGTLRHEIQRERERMLAATDEKTRTLAAKCCKEAEEALVDHDRIQRLQRRGMETLLARIDNKEPETAFTHWDFKTKWFLPWFLQDIRPSLTSKFIIHECGNRAFLPRSAKLELTVPCRRVRPEGWHLSGLSSRGVSRESGL